MSHLPVNGLHRCARANTELRPNSFRLGAEEDLVARFTLKHQSVFPLICFLTPNLKSPCFHAAFLSHYRLLTAVGARLMTSSGFPSALCYSELSKLSSYSSSPPLFSTPSSQPPLTRRGCHTHVSPLTHVEVSQAVCVSLRMAMYHLELKWKHMHFVIFYFSTVMV